MKQNEIKKYDYVIIGSGFGGSVSALRLAEKGYKVLVIEKGKWFKAKDFPKTNWNLKKWLWEPRLKLHGFFKMTYLNHVTVLSGVGVGGGSLTYANTLPVPKKEFFNSGSWAGLNNWEEMLQPHYKEAYKMLGAEDNPYFGPADELIQDLSKDLNREKDFDTTKVAVHFGKAGQTIEDPYFNGKGPKRTGCIHCGACMTGCRHNAKNTLDKNYLYLAQQLGVEIIAEHEVFDVVPLNNTDGVDGYHVFFKNSIGKKKKKLVQTQSVIFSGGVMGTVPLLLQLKEKNSLPKLSAMVGGNIRTNNESLLLLTSTEKKSKDYTKGIAIGSILHIDKNSHLEPVRYGKGSSFFKMLTIPSVHHKYAIVRILGVFAVLLKSPLKLLKTIFSTSYSTRTTVLLFMQTLDSTLRFKLGKVTLLKTEKESSIAPSGFIPEASKLAKILGKKVKAIPYSNFADVMLGTPTTAHILGGAVMGKDVTNGVINKENKVFGYENMYVCDGSMISANPGVNPSLSITAITELAMSKIPNKK
ncbi:GMC oxidoreductase [Tenacibaculum sp. M341]|uniref:GMC oxidoreductase n=1 Tax=Tenacibaculum sp. M341 TaxID=2530339 RepID=UPI0010533E70|nr:GMC oxidoreductase [Tenacibaculum sp. M341]TCI90129.1 GMC family oxidoreductase [Tenacibaculum sp. M341]